MLLKTNETNPTDTSLSTGGSKEKALNSLLETNLSCCLAWPPLHIQNTGIELYDPFPLSESPSVPKPWNPISLNSKSSKNLLPMQFSKSLIRSPSKKLVTSKLESFQNNSKFYVLYDDFKRSKSSKRLTPLKKVSSSNKLQNETFQVPRTRSKPRKLRVCKYK